MPQDVQLRLVQRDPPVVTVTWRAPREAHGEVEGYKLLYGYEGGDSEEHPFDQQQSTFTTGYLRKYQQVKAQTSRNTGNRRPSISHEFSEM